jgi:hypothetical protein
VASIYVINSVCTKSIDALKSKARILKSKCCCLINIASENENVIRTTFCNIGRAIVFVEGEQVRSLP